MAAITASPIQETMALQELARFLRLARNRLERGQATQMFSSYIDAAWHRLVAEPDAYDRFCVSEVGAVMGHQPLLGEGRVDWIREYEADNGPLHDLWFTHADGRIDADRRTRYLHSSEVVASWDCVPSTNDPDE